MCKVGHASCNDAALSGYLCGGYHVLLCYENSQFVRKAGSSQNWAHPNFGRRALLTVRVVLSKDSGGGALDL